MSKSFSSGPLEGWTYFPSTPPPSPQYKVHGTSFGPHHTTIKLYLKKKQPLIHAQKQYDELKKQLFTLKKKLQPWDGGGPTFEEITLTGEQLDSKNASEFSFVEWTKIDLFHQEFRTKKRKLETIKDFFNPPPRPEHVRHEKWLAKTYHPIYLRPLMLAGTPKPITGRLKAYVIQQHRERQCWNCDKKLTLGHLFSERFERIQKKKMKMTVCGWCNQQ